MAENVLPQIFAQQFKRSCLPEASEKERCGASSERGSADGEVGVCNIVDGGTEYDFLEKYIFYSNLNRHYAIMKHTDARDKEKEDSDEKNIVYHKRYSHYRRDSAGVFYGLFVDTKQYCGKCADPGSIYF